MDNQKLKEKFLDYYIEIQKDNNSSAIRESGKFNRLFISMLLGTLVLSVTFLINTIKEFELNFIPIFKLSLVFISISLLFEMLGYFTVQRHFEQRRIDIEKWYKKTVRNNEVQNFIEENLWTRITRSLGSIAFGFGFSGLLWFAVFGFMLIDYIEQLPIPIV